ncbi:hypothetical protein Dred_0882 [Desulforamulus reducens MI-1]|uniref:Uncharacterized protein n=1 Tax=Desulforamulus reducens (strain ATCC BAA-1160 / DSM 100696 / MI-1) TaxID=349161 RepID=A4J2W6_DESRM|nr:hypothetical protein [Desulforamulus reducens]ABO49419.1 hypothetical protein Dred_0882 [Desulforamulus reducens MI-1]
MKNNYIVNDNGVVNTGHIGGSVINISSNFVDWEGLTQNLDRFLIDCDDKELRKIASEMLKDVRAKKVDQTKQSAKRFGEKGLNLVKQLGLNILSGFIVYALTQ